MSGSYAARRGAKRKGAMPGCFHEQVTSRDGCFRETLVMKSTRVNVSPGAGMGRAGQRRTQWLAEAYERLNELAALPEGWDGKRAPSVALLACRTAVEVLGELAAEPTPRPDISPSLDGGLLLEWDRDGYELDVFVEPDGAATVYYEHGESGWDGDWESKREGVRLVLTHHFSPPSRATV